MTHKLNFLYCFDKNYNSQALTSIISLLNHVNEEIDISIIHSDNDFKSKVPENIKNHRYLNSIKIEQFNDFNYFFPNTENVHITEATYYRIFIDNYLNKQVKYFIFLDCDTICLNNPIPQIKSEIEKLNKKGFVLSARTEHEKEINVTNEIYKRLNMNGPYFNAGVMIINFEKWIKNNMKDKLIQNLKQYKNDISQWDQDVLNSVIDGDYLELDVGFNFPANKLNKKKQITNNLFFLHFLGSKKPWLTSGVFNFASEFYHLNFRKIFSNYYHIEHKWKRASIYELLISIFSLKIRNLNKPLIYIGEFVKSILKKK
tara:strand:+ start:277 stop:1221 length:945 start_codon:yes stop_codon:yes gene_type:complete